MRIEKASQLENLALSPAHMLSSSDCQLTSDGVASLADGVSKSLSLEVLDMFGNTACGTSGLQSLIEEWASDVGSGKVFSPFFLLF